MRGECGCLVIRAAAAQRLLPQHSDSPFPLPLPWEYPTHVSSCQLPYKSHCAGGLVQVTQLAVLPSPSPAATLLLVLLAMLPCLFSLWQNPKPDSFLSAAVYASLCSFMFGYHVHEKAILMVTIPMAMAAADSQQSARQYFVLSTAGHIALMPLLFTEQEYLVKVSLAVSIYPVDL